MSNVHEASIFFREAAGTGDWWYSEWLCRVCVARHYSSPEHLQVSPFVAYFHGGDKVRILITLDHN